MRVPNSKPLHVTGRSKRTLKSSAKTLLRYERPVSICAVLIAFVVAWELAVRYFAISTFLLPAPSVIISEFITEPGLYLNATLYTFMTTFIGFVLAVVFGVALAVGVVYSTFIERTIYTLLVALNAVPKVAMAPLFVIWMGVGISPKIAIALTIAIFSIVIAMVQGLRGADPDLLALAQASRAPAWQVLFKIRMPSALPSLFSGMKISVSVALVGAIVGEFVAGSQGLGQLILVAEGNFQTPRMFVALVILGLMGTVLYYAVEFLEKIMTPWHVSRRDKTGK